MSEIQQLRKKVDSIDEEILEKLSERAIVCRKIGRVKKKNGIQIKDGSREDEIFKRVKQKAAALHLEPLQIETIYREIVNMCSAVQE